MILASSFPQAAAIARLRLVSPLQALTIWDPEVKNQTDSTTWRNRFLPKYKVGLEAETAVRKEYESKRQTLLTGHMAMAKKGNKRDRNTWAQRVQKAERDLLLAEERAAEQAFDRATTEYEKQQQEERKQRTAQTPTNLNRYQFVGVIHPPMAQSSSSSSSPIITWYARPKPSNAKWSIRLVHVNRQAVIKDLFQQGKVDLFAKYSNSGQVDEATGLPIITSQYKIRERSWR